MARAYIVLTRNDLPDNLLQVLDLKPNPSQRNYIYDGAGQGGYQSFFLLDGVNGAITIAGVPRTVDGDTYGLSAYLADTVENAVGDRSLTSVQAANASGAIEDRVAQGLALTAAAVNTILVANVGAGTALGEGNGTATLEEILRILAGERYRVPDGAVLEDGAPNFIGARRGAFVARPNVETADSVRTTHGNDRALRGRRYNSPLSHLRAGEPRLAPVQTGLQDTNFQDVRANVDSGELHLSAATGVLADLKSASYTFLNSAFTYGAGGSALDIGGTEIPVTGIARAVVVYDNAGNLI